MGVHATRRAALSEALRPGEGLLVSSLDDIRWMTGFTGSNALVLLRDGETTLWTDGRYTEQAGHETDGVTVRIVQGPLHDAVGAGTGGLSVVLGQADHVPHATWATLERSLQESGPDAPRLLEDLDAPVLRTLRNERAGKDATELDAIRRALAITEGILSDILGALREGVTELDIAADIEYRQRRAGATAASFPSIVAFGTHSALPHARPTDRPLGPGMPILMDYGCVVGGYCSDMTRMAWFGEPDAAFMDAYSAVDHARQAAIDAARAGMSSSELDAVARTVLKDAGLADRFSHSLGHGVGLNVHEYPPVSFRSDAVLPVGSVITVEPGIYIPGAWGIRIEDMVVLASDGAHRLNTLGTELLIVSP